MNAKQVLYGIATGLGIVLLFVIALGVVVTAWNSAKGPAPVVVNYPNPDGGRHACGCSTGGCNCCEECICHKRPHVHPGVTPGSLPTGAAPLGAKGEKDES